MLDTSHDFAVASQELGLPVEQLLTPLTRFKAQKPEDHFAMACTHPGTSSLGIKSEPEYCMIVNRPEPSSS